MVTPIHFSTSTTYQTNAVESPRKNPFIFFPDANKTIPLHLYGGKALNLQRLSSVESISVPAWFAISSEMFNSFLEENQILPYILRLEELTHETNPSEEQFLSLANLIQDLIRNGRLNNDHLQIITSSIEELKKSIQSQNPRFAVRSSGVMEDTEGSSCAGLYDSILNSTTGNTLIHDVLNVWASSFNPRVVKERLRLGINQTDCKMSVIVQQLIDAQSSGVGSSLVLSNNYPGIEIATNYGLGESVVSGEESVDSWIVHPQKGYILQQTKGNKKFAVTSHPKSGTMRIEIPEQMRNQFVLHPEEIKELARQVSLIAKIYQCNVDVEFALDERRNIFILQARPLVVTDQAEVQVVSLNAALQNRIVAKGLYSLPGVAIGRLIYINSLDELASGRIQLTKEDIALAYVTTNVWSQYFFNIKGLITQEGAPSSHPILLSRERRIPCVIGITQDFEQLLALNGQVVTIDGYNQCVYEGAAPLQKAVPSDLQKQFAVIPLRSWPDVKTSLPHLLHNQTIVEHGGRFWRRTPTYQITGFQQELNMMRFLLVPTLLRKEHVSISARIIDGYTCNELVPFDEYVALFEDFDLQDCAAFNSSHAETLCEFLELSKTFELTPSHWTRYIQTYAKLRAFIWLGGAYRAYSERKIDIIGIKNELPTHYLEACSQLIQDSMAEIDTEMQNALYDFAISLNGKELPQTLQDLREINTRGYDQIIELSKRFRFEHSISLEKPVNLDFIYQRIKQEVQKILEGSSRASGKQTSPHSREYLTGLPELKEWLKLSIQNRILQSDSHHIDAAAKAHVHPKLMQLGQKLTKLGLLETAGNIFSLTIDQISRHLTF